MIHQALAALLVYLSFTAAAAKACALRSGFGRLRAAIFAAWAGGEALLSTSSQAVVDPRAFATCSLMVWLQNDHEELNGLDFLQNP